MRLFTTDAVAVLSYLADKLPIKSNEIFKQAENGLVRIQVPEILKKHETNIHPKR